MGKLCNLEIILDSYNKNIINEIESFIFFGFFWDLESDTESS